MLCRTTAASFALLAMMSIASAETLRSSVLKPARTSSIRSSPPPTRHSMLRPRSMTGSWVLSVEVPKSFPALPKSWTVSDDDLTYP